MIVCFCQHVAMKVHESVTDERTDGHHLAPPVEMRKRIEKAKQKQTSYILEAKAHSQVKGDAPRKEAR